jgi:hypothetical protein
MRPIAACFPVVLTGAILLATTILLGTTRLEYCGQPEALRPQTGAAAATKSCCPTLAPRQKVVYLRVESDKPDLEVAWADN